MQDSMLTLLQGSSPPVLRTVEEVRTNDVETEEI